MKIAITHPNIKSVIDKEHQPVYIQEIGKIELSSCVSVNLADCMDYVPLKERGNVLNTAIERLRYGGEITISGADILAICAQVSNGHVTIEQANTSIYGSRLSGDTITNVIGYLQSINMEIVNAKLDHLYYSIKAKRKNRVKQR